MRLSWTHLVLAPATVTQRSLDPGSRSCATLMLAWVVSLISFTLLPPFPMMDPHWEAGTTNLDKEIDSYIHYIRQGQYLQIAYPRFLVAWNGIKMNSIYVSSLCYLKKISSSSLEIYIFYDRKNFSRSFY